MKKVVLIGLLSLCGASLFASGGTPVNVKPLLDAALNDASDVAKAKEFVDAVRALRFDVDKKMYTKKKTYGTYLAEELGFAKKDPAKKARIEGFLKDLQQYRSAPDEADDLRDHINEVDANATKLPDLVEFLKDKELNIDLIAYNPGRAPHSIGDELDALRQDHAAIRSILRLERIKLFRTKAVDPVDTLRDLLEDTITDDKKLVAFAGHYTDILRTNAAFDIDKVQMSSTQTIGDYLNDELAKKDVNEGALQIAELVQAERSKKDETVRALFEAYELDPKNADLFKGWVKKHRVDIDAVAYDEAAPAGDKLGDKLNALLASTDAAVKAAAVVVTDYVRPYRVGLIKGLKDLLDAYKTDKTKLADIEAWLKNNPVDIDVIALDPAQPAGQTIGESVNALKDDALSALFKDKRSKDPVAAASWFSPKKLFIAAVVAGTGIYLWHKHASSKTELDAKDHLPVIR